jgi:pimeloyl-ACP methyl ester carboxylesterase
MVISDKLNERKLPDLLTLKNGEIADSPELWRKRRLEIIELLSSEIYGFAPPPPRKASYAVKQQDNNAFAGKAVHSVIDIQFNTPKGEFSFPFNLIVPKDICPAPLFLNIAFTPDIPDKYYPTEEIIDGGFAVASFCYQDVAPDMDDGFVGGLAGMYAGDTRSPDEWGKISMWAWAAQRVMDYLQTLDEIDRERIAVVGHSRLGKTALWCAAQDERFAAGISNNSGCSGAAITRDKTGERIKDITDRFGYWFCDNYKKYRNNEESMPFDQHFLLAAIAPRLVYVCSAEDDEWADPQSEFLSCAAAQKVYELFGLKGLMTRDELPQPGTCLHEGEIGYHIRKGAHFLSRYDWQCFMEYMKKRTCGK